MAENALYRPRRQKEVLSDTEDHFYLQANPASLPTYKWSSGHSFMSTSSYKSTNDHFYKSPNDKSTNNNGSG